MFVEKEDVSRQLHRPCSPTPVSDVSESLHDHCDDVTSDDDYVDDEERHEEDMVATNSDVAVPAPAYAQEEVVMTSQPEAVDPSAISADLPRDGSGIQLQYSNDGTVYLIDNTNVSSRLFHSIFHLIWMAAKNLIMKLYYLCLFLFYFT